MRDVRARTNSQLRYGREARWGGAGLGRQDGDPDRTRGAPGIATPIGSHGALSSRARRAIVPGVRQ